MVKIVSLKGANKPEKLLINKNTNPFFNRENNLKNGQPISGQDTDSNQ
jgi:hypothetical protein